MKVGPKIVDEGLSFFIDAANKLSYTGAGTSAKDIITKNNAPLQNGVSYSDQKGGYFIFDGADDKISIANDESIQTSGNFSLNIWFKGNSTQGGGAFAGIVSKSVGGDFGDWSIAGDSSNRYFRFGFKNTSNQNRTFQTPTYQDLISEEWVNYQCTYDMSKIKIYRNSVLMLNSTETSTPITQSSALLIGSRGYGSYFTGEIAMFSLYKNKALTQDEVTQNYEATKQRFI
jgi:hypothetical protein